MSAKRTTKARTIGGPIRLPKIHGHIYKDATLKVQFSDGKTEDFVVKDVKIESDTMTISGVLTLLPIYTYEIKFDLAPPYKNVKRKPRFTERAGGKK